MEPRERIATKAEELFMQYGIRSVSMDDIANNLGMSKKTLYQYFADKDDLVDAVVEAHITRMQEDCGSCRQESKNAIEEVFLSIDRILVEFNNMNPTLLHDLEKFHFRAYQRIRTHKEKFLMQLVRDNMEWGMREGLYREDLDVEVLCRFRIESMMVPFNVGLFPPSRFSLSRTSEIIIEHFIYGLSTLKGHRLIQKLKEQRQKRVLYEEQDK